MMRLQAAVLRKLMSLRPRGRKYPPVGAVGGQENGLWAFMGICSRYWKILALTAALALAGATLYAESLPDEYEAPAVVSITPKAEPLAASADIVRLGTSRYVAYATAPATIRGVAAMVSEDVQDFQRRLDVTVASETGDITIIVREQSPMGAAAAANSLAAEVIRRAGSDPLLNAQLTGPAIPPPEPSGPHRWLIEITAVLAAALVAFALVAAIDQRRRAGAERGEARLTRPPAVVRLPWPGELGSSPGAALSDPGRAAAVAQIAHGVQAALGRFPRGVLFVTSGADGEGISTVARLLATALARSGRVGVLNGHTWSSRDGASARGQLSHARNQFDLIIIDGPALAESHDRERPVSAADCALLVVSGAASGDSVGDALSMLSSLGLPLVAIVVIQGAPRVESSTVHGSAVVDGRVQ